MAGDWIKMEVSTPDKPEVLAIAARMGWDDPDYVVGKLFRVWRWFDQHTTDGNADGVTVALLDRIAGVSGFAEAMANVGWLDASESGISLPRFEKHCGRTAKERAQTAKRVANFKSNGGGNGPSNGGGNAETVTEALPREEKRREEENPTPTPSLRSGRVQSDAGFERFWSAYPRRRNRGQAEKAWAKLKPDGSLLGRILQAVEVAKSRDDWRKDGGRFVPYPATWLNAKGWEDEDAPAAPGDPAGWWLSRGYGSERSAIEAGEVTA